MGGYSRVLLSFVYASHTARARGSVLFATQLTRVTHPLTDQRGAAVFTRIAREVQDWGGGTRIGEALRTFNLRWARRVIRNGPIVLIVSDGWDRGDPALLDRELARIRRSCRGDWSPARWSADTSHSRVHAAAQATSTTSCPCESQPRGARGHLRGCGPCEPVGWEAGQR